MTLPLTLLSSTRQSPLAFVLDSNHIQTSSKENLFFVMCCSYKLWPHFDIYVDAGVFSYIVSLNPSWTWEPPGCWTINRWGQGICNFNDDRWGKMGFGSDWGQGSKMLLRLCVRERQRCTKRAYWWFILISTAHTCGFLSTKPSWVAMVTRWHSNLLCLDIPTQKD